MMASSLLLALPFSIKIQNSGWLQADTGCCEKAAMKSSLIRVMGEGVLVSSMRNKHVLTAVDSLSCGVYDKLL